MEEYNTHNGGSNPDLPHLNHIFTTLISWDQIESILLPNINKARSEKSFATKVPRQYMTQQSPAEENSNNNLTSTSSNNVYERKETWNVVHEINYRLNLPIHKCTSIISTMNTLKYLFYHMKCGIFVMIRNGKLRIFAPFVNSEYRNTWGNQMPLEGDGSLSSYYSQKLVNIEMRRLNQIKLNGGQMETLYVMN